MQVTVTAMVTKRRVPIAKPPAVKRIPFYLREWRRFMGSKAIDCAEALDIERESYLRLERETWRLNLAEVEILAKVIGVKSSQFRFPPPEKGQPVLASLDEMLEEAPENLRPVAIAAFLAIIGK